MVPEMQPVLPIAFTDDTGWPVSFSAVGLPPGLSIDATTGCISGTIYYGAETPSPYTVSVTATDTATQLSDTATFPWTVSALPPVAMDATLTMGRDQILPDIDLNQYVDVGGGDWLSFTIVSQPANGTLTQGGYGIYVYTPNAGFAGTDSFSIQANNGVQDSNVATITIEVAPYAPSAGDGSYAVLANHTLPYIDFSKNDPNAGGDPSAISIVSGPAHGTLTANSDGTYNYTPEAGY